MNKKNIIIASVVLVLIVLGILVNSNKSVESAPIEEKEDSQFSSHQIIVDIKGEVKNPGLYYLSSNSRVIDAINIAGGVTAYADIEKINLATKLTDEMVVNVFRKKDEILSNKVNINTSSIDELTKLPGIGEAKAKGIIEYREKYGFYMSLEEIIKADGINENLFKQIKELICL